MRCPATLIVGSDPGTWCMRSQLYLPEMTRQHLKAEIQSFVRIYTEKLLPVFADIEGESNKISNDFYDDVMSQPIANEVIDPASIAEQATNLGIRYYSYLSLGKYNLTATWHATLYQLWEQQTRSFLFKEMSHVYKYEFRSFCTKIGEIKEAFSVHNVVIESFISWPKIDELRLLCNVIKHGAGDSEEKLRKTNLTLFKKETALIEIKKEIDVLDTCKTTLLEETLRIDETTLKRYSDALLSFCDEIPKRNYSDEL